MKAQTLSVLNLLRARGADGLTPAEARAQLACDRLAARVHELRAEGYRIVAIRERSPMGAVYARYVFEGWVFAAPTGHQETWNMTRQCAYSPACRRQPIPTTPGGTVFANCFEHHAILLPSWHDSARAYQLRPAVVGGVPIDQDPEKEVEVNGVVPLVAS